MKNFSPGRKYLNPGWNIIASSKWNSMKFNESKKAKPEAQQKTNENKDGCSQQNVEYLFKSKIQKQFFKLLNSRKHFIRMISMS